MKVTVDNLKTIKGLLNIEASQLAEPYRSRIADLTEFLTGEIEKDNLPADPDKAALELVKRFALSQKEPHEAVRLVAETLALNRVPDIQQRYGRNRDIKDPTSLLTTFLQTEIILSDQ